jgi:hypothetical protein
MTLLNPLNRDAGSVPFPEDHREIEAALRAGKISYRLFPYLAWRYKERGVKFTRSDSAWLAWLSRHPQDFVDEQILWLRDVLSNRGMPSWILERHLRVLHRQLARRIPDNEPQYVRLLDSAERLKFMSEECLSPERADLLVDEFIETLGRKRSAVLAGTARLLVMAVADEKSGVEFAVSSLQDWLTDASGLREIAGLREYLSPAELRFLDSETFEKTWPQAVAQTVRKARKS